MKSRERALVAVALLIAFVIGYFLLVVPKHHQASQVQSEITTEQGDLTQAELAVANGLHDESEYKTYAKQLKAISTAVPGDDQIPELINQLQAASTKDKVGFQTVSVSGSSSASTTSTATAAATSAATSAAFPSQSFNLSFTGNYFSVVRLLGTLASFVRADDTHVRATGRLLSIGTLSLTPGGSASSTATAGSGVVTAAITTNDYDVPTALLPLSSTAVSSLPATSTASPAAYVTP